MEPCHLGQAGHVDEGSPANPTENARVSHSPGRGQRNDAGRSACTSGTPPAPRPRSPSSGANKSSAPASSHASMSLSSPCSGLAICPSGGGRVAQPADFDGARAICRHTPTFSREAR
jgi:hypothetical protein